MSRVRALLDEFAAELGVLVVCAGFGAFLVVGTGCAFGDACDCTSNPEPTPNGTYVIDAETGDPLDGSMVSFQGDRVTLDYEVSGESVSVEYVITDIIDDSR